MAHNRIENVNELYADRTLYSSQDMFSPPAERLPHVIRFELTRGCDWGKCTYCEGFDGIRTYTKTPEEYEKHVDAIWARICNESELANKLRRIFIGGGNALEVESDQLVRAIRYTGEKFRLHTSGNPKRISIYGRTDSIKNKGEANLRRLYNAGGRQFGLDLIYWGVESGSSEVLEYVNKGCTQEDILAAANAVVCTNVRTSVMIMPGLGGKKFYEDHVRGTAKVLGEIRPNFLTFMGVNPSSRSAYERRMRKEEAEGTNRHLTDSELAEQMVEIIDSMPCFLTKIGCYDCNIDAVGHNPITFGSVQIKSERDKADLIRGLKLKIDGLK